LLNRLRDSRPARWLSGAGSRFLDTFIRDNRVLPPVLAVLALAVFAWIVAGLFVGTPGSEEPASNRADLVQAEDPTPRNESPAPEIENRNVDSYAAYRSKDPFRELLAPADASDGESPTSPEPTTGDEDGGTGAPDRGTDRGTDRGAGRGDDGGVSRQDSDGDGISDERERNLGLDPDSSDTDGDGVPDGEENRGGRRGGGLKESGGPGSSPGAGGRDSLPDSGGAL
jgi:hypothetical protein